MSASGHDPTDLAGLNEADDPGELDERTARLATMPLDDVDAAVLTALAGAVEQLDPPPAGLTERVQFALALDEVYDEVAQLQRLTDRAGELAGARSADADAAEQVSRITFTAGPVTVMVTVLPVDGATVRVDGWLAPTGAAPGAAEGWLVRVRGDGGDRQATVDADGRFSLDRTPRGLTQLVFVPPEPTGHAVVTPSFEL